MKPARNRFASPRNRGVALIVGLVILAILSMIGIAAFAISTQEERMSGNSRDRIRAFEAAETALRGCETLVAGGALFDGSVPGLYPAPPVTAPSVAEGLSDQDWQTSTGKINQVKPTFANGGSLGSAYPPACVAELLTLPTSHQGGTSLNTSNSINIAHITARGYGLNPNTVVRLESYYAM